MSLNKSKTDAKLGLKVHKYLKEQGVETPGVGNDSVENDVKIEIIQDSVATIMKALGLDLSDDSLRDTPKRVAKMYVNEIFWGLDIANFPKITTVDNKMKYDEMIIERNVNVQSNCEHHLVVISGKATVAYIPKDKVLGLSKINRIVEYYSKRPQIQERLAEQIYHALACILETDNVAVVIDAEHYCVKSRGVEDVGSSTVTSKLGGAFRKAGDARAEFMKFIPLKD